MILFRLKHVTFAVLLLASLLTTVPAACTCSQPGSSVASKGDYPSHHEAEPRAEVSGTANFTGGSSCCIIDQRSPCVSSKLETKEPKSNAPLCHSERISIAFERAAINIVDLSLPIFTRGLSYSTTLRSLLPSRAPPRL